jgi:hypothetical protein
VKAIADVFGIPASELQPPFVQKKARRDPPDEN